MDTELLRILVELLRILVWSSSLLIPFLGSAGDVFTSGSGVGGPPTKWRKENLLLGAFSSLDASLHWFPQLSGLDRCKRCGVPHAVEAK